ncbi:MAG TPA: TPM domain-containing protein [Ktedonobacterales bacterium]|nr:TPM domain-containing protein [Ktedonobacterales bacterium]
MAGKQVYDCAGILTARDIDMSEAHARALAQAGAPVVVYLQANDATYDETYDDAGNLMQRWDVESQPGAHDGLVIFLNLIPGNEHHGEIALFAGEKHFQHGNLPQSELEHTYQEVMLPSLKRSDLSGALAAGLDEATRALIHGPYVNPVQRAAANFGRLPFNLLAALLAAASLWQSRQFRYKPADLFATKGRHVTPPSDLAPALAGALAQGRVKEAQVEATLVDFARRGLVAFEPVGDKAQVRLVGNSDGLSVYERLLWPGLKVLAGPDRIVATRQVPNLKGNWSAVKQALRADMLERGWYDPQASVKRQWLYVAAVICWIFVVVAIVVALIAQEG